MHCTINLLTFLFSWIALEVPAVAPATSKDIGERLVFIDLGLLVKPSTREERRAKFWRISAKDYNRFFLFFINCSRWFSSRKRDALFADQCNLANGTLSSESRKAANRFTSIDSSSSSFGRIPEAIDVSRSRVCPFHKLEIHFLAIWAWVTPSQLIHWYLFWEPRPCVSNRLVVKWGRE